MHIAKKIIIFLFLFNLLPAISIADDYGPLVPPSFDIVTLPATNVDESSAQLHGWYGWGGNDPATCGFIYGTEFPLYENASTSTNVTVSGTYNNQSVSKIVTGLNSSTCYYFYLWAINSTGWHKAYNTKTFLTYPSGPPQNFTVVNMGSDNITLSWDNATDYQQHTSDPNFYQETVIRYSDTHQPTSPTDGYLGYQGTAESCTITGLDLDQQYYFSAWTHIVVTCPTPQYNSSGYYEGLQNIVCHRNSTEFATTTAYTQGGRYNITIRYENRTYGPVNLTRYGPHKMIIYYYGQNLTSYFGETDYIIFYNNATDYTDMDTVTNTSQDKTISLTYHPSHFIGVYKYENNTEDWYEISSSKWSYNSTTNSVTINHTAFDNDTKYVKVVYGTLETFVVEHDPMAYFDLNVTNLSQGKISFSVNRTVKFIAFHWNDTDATSYRCNRIIVTETGQRDYDIFIRDDLPVYGEGASTKNHTLVKYTYSFTDETGKFKLQNNPRAYIYTYDDDGNKLIIHSEYFDTELHINPWLVYEKEYFIGVKCDVLEYERIGRAPAYDDLTPEIRIPYEWKYNYSFFDIINISTGWYSNGFYVVYRDTTYSTVLATFKVYSMINNTLLYTTTTTSSYKNFTYPCNQTQNYLWEITTVIDDVANTYDGTYCSGKIPVFGSIEPIISNSTLNRIIGIILGPSPIYYDPDKAGGTEDHPASSVPWTYILIFGASFIWLTTLGRLNASIAGFGVGAILTFSGVVISGAGQLFANYQWWEGPMLVVIGLFVLAISFVHSLGGIEH